MKLSRDLREFIELLNRQKVEYLLVGGWAFSFHAAPRYTGDINFLCRCDKSNAERLKAALESFGFSELPGFESCFLEPGRILQFGVPPNRIDILTRITGVEFAEAWENRLHGDLDGLPVALINRELLLKNRLAAGRPKDLADVEALRKTAPKT